LHPQSSGIKGIYSMRVIVYNSDSSQVTLRLALPSPPRCFGRPYQVSSQVVKNHISDKRSLVAPASTHVWLRPTSKGPQNRIHSPWHHFSVHPKTLLSTPAKHSVTGKHPAFGGRFPVFPVFSNPCGETPVFWRIVCPFQ